MVKWLQHSLLLLLLLHIPLYHSLFSHQRISVWNSWQHASFMKKNWCSNLFRLLSNLDESTNKNNNNITSSTSPAIQASVSISSTNYSEIFSMSGARSTAATAPTQTTATGLGNIASSHVKSNQKGSVSLSMSNGNRLPLPSNNVREMEQLTEAFWSFAIQWWLHATLPLIVKCHCANVPNPILR